MSFMSLLVHQIRYNLIAFARNRQSGFFTVLFPVVLLVLFVAVFGNNTVGDDHVNASTYYVPGIGALAVVTASFANLVISITTQRETGIFRRRRSTPVPAGVLIAAQTASALLTSLASIAIVVVVGRIAYGTTLHGSALPGVLLTTLVGSIACTCLAYAVSTAITSIDSAQPTVQAIVLPLYFISGVFIPNPIMPLWLQELAKVLPVEHLANGLRLAFDPAVQDAAVPWTDVAILAAWAAVGLAVALRRFTWSPSTATG
jgi:ABC-2 type transport system permease protein